MADTIEAPTPAPAAPVKDAVPTRESLKEAGWSAEELVMAEKHGTIPKPKKEKDLKEETTAVAPPEKPETAPEPEAVATPEKKEEPVKTEAVKPAGIVGVDIELTPEKEKAFLDAFGPGTSPRALYFRQKAERKARQEAQSRAEKAESELTALKAAKSAPTDPALEDENRTLTFGDLKRMAREHAEAQTKAQREAQEASARVQSHTKDQEEYAKSVHADFDPTLELAADVIRNFKTMFPEPWRQGQVLSRLQELQQAAARADSFGIEERNAAFIAYEIGQMHPNYGKAKADPTKTDKTEPPKAPTAPGGRKPETLKRIEENTQRRGSSAGLPSGGGERSVVADDVSVDTFNGWDYKKRAAFKESHPEAYGRLMRG